MKRKELAILLGIPSYHVDEMFWDMVDVDKLLNVINERLVKNNDTLPIVCNSEAEFCECEVKNPEIKAMWVVCGYCGKVIKDD